MSQQKMNFLLEGMDRLKEKAVNDKEWCNLISNTPASERNKFARQASFMLARDASQIIDDMTSHRQAYFKRPKETRENPFDSLLHRIKPSKLNSDVDKLLENQLQAYGENINFDFKDLMPQSKDKILRE